MPEYSTLNAAVHLVRMAAEFPARVAIHYPRGRVKPEGRSDHEAITFAELNADADVIAHGLVGIGITRGTRTALMVPPSPDFFALTFALFKIAAVPILIDPGMGIRNLGKCLSEAEPEAFIGIAKANVARRVLGWARKSIRTTVNVGRGRLFCTSTLARLREAGVKRGAYTIPEVACDETAAVLFTSGSTGVAKGAVYSHGNFAAQVESLKATYGIDPGEIDLCTFPLFALFGPALGMTCVIPDMDASRPARIDPRKAVAQIRQFGVTNLFGSPAVIRRLGDWASGGRETADIANRELTPPARLPSLRRVISAGAPASASAIERFVKLLPETAQVFTPYGATEALPVANIGSGEILGETRKLTEQGKGVCVGRPVAGMQVRVIPISDVPIPEWDESMCLPPGEVGEIVVRGPVVTRSYHNRPEATRLAKIRDPKTGEILHRMGDVGYLDDTGRLWFCGRKSHRVITPYGTLFTDMIEPIFNTVPGVMRTALVGVTREGVTFPVLCAELVQVAFRGVRRKRRLRFINSLHEVGQRFAQTRAIDTILIHPAFPVDVRHNSKIFREKLAVWADRETRATLEAGGRHVKVLVTGGGGFLGGAIVRLLRQRGDIVRSLTRTNYPWLDELGVEQSLGDLADVEAVERAAAGSDVVIHTAARAGVWGRYAAFYQTNVTGTENVINACRKHGVRKLIYTSTPSVVHGGGDIENGNESLPYPRHFDAHYQQTKAMAEQAVLAANGAELATVALRPHLIFGPGDPHLIPRIISKAREGKLRRIGSRPVRVDVTYIDNAADAHCDALDRLEIGSSCSGKAYFISNGEPVELWAFIDRVLAEAMLPPVSRRISAWKARFAGRALEWLYWLLRLPGEPPMTRFVAVQMSTAHWYDISAARRDLGYVPKVSLEEGLRRLGVRLRAEA